MFDKLTHRDSVVSKGYEARRQQRRVDKEETRGTRMRDRAYQGLPYSDRPEDWLKDMTGFSRGGRHEAFNRTPLIKTP